MAYPTWLMFSDNDIKMDEFFWQINLPLDCLFLLSIKSDNHSIIKEIYKISPHGPPKSLIFATWNQINGFNHTHETRYERRHDLFGQELRIVSTHVSLVWKLNNFLSI